MAQFTAQRAALGSQPVVDLDARGGPRARIACHGAALLSLVTPDSGAPRDIAWGYRNADEIVARAGSHFAILAPFGGRIANARYTFEGRSFDLQPGVNGDARGIRHGFVRDADFTIEELAADGESARVTLATDAIRPRPGYPFAIDLTLAFTLSIRELTLVARMRNVGDEPAPCFFGWHAYLRAGSGTVDDWTLTIPAQTVIRTDAHLIALPGGGAYADLDHQPDLDFRSPRPIGKAVLDTGYTDLVRGADGRTHTRLTAPDSGLAIDVWQEHGVMHAFTADTLATGARSAIALEPMECMADAFNRPECADAIRLEPGAERRYRCGIAFDGA